MRQSALRATARRGSRDTLTASTASRTPTDAASWATTSATPSGPSPACCAIPTRAASWSSASAARTTRWTRSSSSRATSTRAASGFSIRRTSPMRWTRGWRPWGSSSPQWRATAARSAPRPISSSATNAAADEPGGRRDRVSADRHPDQRFQDILHPPRAADLREPLAGQRRGGPDHARGEIAGRDPERRPSHRDAGAAVRRARGDGSGRSGAARIARERRRVVHGPGRERRDRAPLHDGPRHPARFPRAHAQDLVQHRDCREEAALDRPQRGSVPRRYRDDGPARGRPVRADPRRGVGTSAREQREARVPRDRDLERRRHTVTSTAAPPTPRLGYRWTICALLFAVTTINYMDRQVLSIL